MVEIIMSKIDSLGLNIKDCRGQSYDNASKMSDCYNGLQARIKKENKLRVGHCLNLVGKCSVESIIDVSNFFVSLQAHSLLLQIINGKH